MNTYLIPVDNCSKDELYIDSIIANSILNAEEKYENKLRGELEEDLPETYNWEEFKQVYGDVTDIYLGDFYDKEEF